VKQRQTVLLVAVLVAIAVIVVAKTATSRGSAPAVETQAAVPEPALQEASAEREPTADTAPEQNAEPTPAEGDGTATADAGPALPQLLELGSVGCKPCEYMAPIIDALEKELAGEVVVKFHDVVNDSPDIGQQYQIMTIPTQIFLDAEGKELFRHTGVFEKEEILAKLRELGMLKE